MYVVILAGGGGTRLRPLSTSARPKPFLPLVSERTLIQQTVDRLLDGDELGLRPGDLSVVVSPVHAAHVRDQLTGVAIIEEPEGRNTCPAIALAAAAIERPDDEVMVVLPADHDIRKAAAFRGVLRDAERELASGAFGIADPLVTLGIHVDPDRPSTQYGYLIPDTGRAQGSATGHVLAAYPLKGFEEKPTVQRARELVAMPGVAWNAGMFLWRRRAIRDAIRRFSPGTLEAIEDSLGTGGLAAAYGAVDARSIDYAVMEPAARAGLVVMGGMEVGWSDIGTWAALLEALGEAGIDGRVVEAGEQVDVRPDDLVVERVDGLVVCRSRSGGTMTPDTPIALLRGARHLAGLVDDLLGRVALQEDSR